VLNTEKGVLMSVSFSNSIPTFPNSGQMVDPLSSSGRLIVDPRIEMVEDTFEEVMEFLDLADLVSTVKVSLSWSDSIGKSHAWKKCTERMGIPLVVSLDGGARNHKEDLKVMYPITLSGDMIAKTIGKPVGKTPPISEKQFLRLAQPDPWEPEKTYGQTFRFVCRYSFVERMLGGDVPLVLDELGNLVAAPKDESSSSSATPKTPEKPKLTKIPLTLKNLRVLSQYPLKGNENMPVFHEDSYEPVFEQCDTCARKNEVNFMRKQIVKETRNKTYVNQLALVKAKGTPELGATPLEVRTLDCAVSILNRGTCPEDRESWTYARASNTVYDGDSVYQTKSGGFFPGSGLRVNDCNFAGGNIGVAPGWACGSSGT